MLTVNKTLSQLHDCVLSDNTTVDNVYIHLDIKLTCTDGKTRVSYE